MGPGAVLPHLFSPGDRKLDREELKYGLRDYGVALSDRELDTVLGAFDKNKDGRIDFDEFLRGIRVRCIMLIAVSWTGSHLTVSRCGHQA
jgi:hypothetical protein